ncbi:UDP-N-acetylmuramoyl-L-alanine--D-glutamate ligase [Undibacterium sp.]|uniref:UDP-N-acetylmuramoyl-L-alanine--D-glutamate ligase n=1 Tax=Undibacterium sp. TaxID=1914977 RepID=UPI002CEE5823|nr:UDP-N-acetylmuramoyl-L-alanine--D-glutamate ligase [Undibacterium sp.]HTD05495.1 UDP-N-acetylmuramoyl-L-alanine--D-glutamate ligase [Undibacterium sp.]
MNFAGKHVLVLGLGESGLAMAHWLLRCGARLRVADTREAPDRLGALRELSGEVQFAGGEFKTDLLDEIDFVAVSPGLSPLRELSELLPAAQQKNIPVWGEIELFAQALAALKQERAYAPKVIAITGTNGKTTVTSLVGLLCQRAGLRTRVAGNISPAVLDVLREELDRDDAQRREYLAQAAADAGDGAQSAGPANAADEAVATIEDAARETTAGETVAAELAEESKPAADDPAPMPDTLPQVWVLELSSFQLHTSFSLQADVATVLNITQDHLDWHGDLAAYAADKARIFGTHTVQVLNRDDALVMALAKPMASIVSFGVGEPENAGDLGLVNEHGMAWLASAAAGEEGQPVGRRKKKDKDAEEAPVAVSRLMPVDALKIRGQHNAANALAALALCRAIGLSFAPLLHGLREYQGEPHRVELIATVAGIDYIDDSKGTNVGATVAALKGIGQESVADFGAKRVILIAGGEGKGQDFSPLAEPVMRYAKAVLLIGKAAAEIRAAIQDAAVEASDCATLEQAVQAATELALEGDIVLLSPACASLDMFRNYAHRAQVFADAVREIGLSRGEVY